MSSSMASALDQITTFVLPERDEMQLAAAAKVLGLETVTTLSPGKAVEGPSEATDSATARTRLKTAGILADVCVQPANGRRKSVLICDMDSTLIAQECIDELADFAGMKDKVSAITERAMRGEIGFEGALIERVLLLKGLPLSVIEKCYSDRITINPGARTLARTMSKHGAKTLIVSGGFTVFTQRIAAACGFANHQANVLLEDGANLSGDVKRPILGREAKLEALLEACEGEPSRALAVGDGANDLAMIEASGLGLAFYAKPAVAAAAHSAINVTDLRSALYFQGYRDTEIVED